MSCPTARLLGVVVGRERADLVSGKVWATRSTSCGRLVSLSRSKGRSDGERLKGFDVGSMDLGGAHRWRSWSLGMLLDRFSSYGDVSSAILGSSLRSDLLHLILVHRGVVAPLCYWRHGSLIFLAISGRQVNGGWSVGAGRKVGVSARWLRQVWFSFGLWLGPCNN